MRASVRTALLVGGAAALALGVAPAVAATVSGPAPAGGWSVTDGRGADVDGKIKTCPVAGADGMHDMPWAAMTSMHRAHHRDQAGEAQDMGAMHRAHHRDGGSGGMMGDRDTDGMMGDRDADGMMDSRDADGMMDSRDGDGMMDSRDADGMMDSRDADGMMGPGHMER